MKKSIANKIIMIMCVMVIVLSSSIIAYLSQVAYYNSIDQITVSSERILRGLASLLDGKETLQISEEKNTNSDLFIKQQKMITDYLEATDTKYLYSVIYDAEAKTITYINDGGDITDFSYLFCNHEVSRK